jgi:methylthioribose-1-phosphate isomerase
VSRSITWQNGHVHLVDQRALPGELRRLRIGDVDALLDAISTLAVRGAPALALAGAFGVALSARRHNASSENGEARVRADAERIARSRPTAVNLARGVERALAMLAEGPEAVLA